MRVFVLFIKQRIVHTESIRKTIMTSDLLIQSYLFSSILVRTMGHVLLSYSEIDLRQRSSFTFIAKMEKFTKLLMLKSVV